MNGICMVVGLLMMFSLSALGFDFSKAEPKQSTIDTHVKATNLDFKKFDTIDRRSIDSFGSNFIKEDIDAAGDSFMTRQVVDSIGSRRINVPRPPNKGGEQDSVQQAER